MNRSKDMLNLENLKKYSLFDNLSDMEMQKIAGLIHIRSCKDGEFVVKEGTVGDELFILLMGELEVSQQLTLCSGDDSDLDTRDKMLTRLKADFHPFVGEMSLFQDHIRSASMRAIGEVTLGVLRKKELMELVVSNPQIGFNLF